MEIHNDDFVHLHVQSEYSFPEGACRLEALISQVRALGQTAVAVTDRETLYSAVLFYQAAKKAGIRPIIGCQFADGGILLCENQTGYQNLIQLVSAKNTGNRITPELWKRCHEGLFLLWSVPDGMDFLTAQRQIQQYQNVFDSAHFFLEVNSHHLPFCKRLSQETGAAPVATNPVLYPTPQEAPVQRILTCIRTGKTADEIPEQKEACLKSAQEMADLFADFPEALINTKKIADNCRLELEFHQQKLPHFYQEGITDNQAYLKDLCQKGLRERYGTNPDLSVRKRLDYELQTIQQMGFTDYFLIVQDFVKYAKRQEIPVGAGRGSAAGSLCAYCLDITEIDPISEHLLFERFLNSGRQSMPDIDIDFCMEGRSKVKEYVINRYGKDHVAEIIAFDTLKAKAAVRDTGRVLQMPSDLMEKTTKLLDSRFRIAECLNQPELKQLCQASPQVKKLLDISAQIEGMPRHTMIHAAGVVITEEPVMHYVPVQKNGTMLVTQYTMTTLEELGILKMDFLGLRNLTIIRDAEKAVQKQNPFFSVRKIPLDDSEVYQFLGTGKTAGVFQLESEGMKSFLKKLRPACMADIIAALAIYRPGPMDSIPMYLENRQHPEKIKYLHPILEPILKSTYGCILYQEQVMEICRKMAGYSYSQADIVRRAMAKKKQDIMQKERQIFLNGCRNHQIPEAVANQVFDQMEQFASYAFNQSHAAAYARIAYQTAYLKYHYFGEYMAALMTSVISETEKLASYAEEYRSTGKKLHPPDVNSSGWNFVFRDGEMQFGLLAIRGFGRGLIDRMLSERRKNGRFTSFSDFCRRMSPLGLYQNKRLLESIIQSGALDTLDYNRKQMLTYAGRMLHYIHDSGSATEGQMSLFGETEHAETLEIPAMTDFSVTEKLQLEKQAVGMYLSGSPLEELQYLQRLLHCHTIAELSALPEQAHVRMIGIVRNVRRYQTKKGDMMAFLTLEDSSGVLDSAVFPEVFRNYQSLLQKNSILYLTGNITRKDNRLSLVCEAFRGQSALPDMLSRMKLCIKISQAESDLLPQIVQICNQFPGETELIFYQTDLKSYLRPKSQLKIQISESGYQELCKVISPEKMGCIPAISAGKS